MKESERRWPDDGIEQMASCPLCGSTDRKLLHGALEDRIFFTAPGTWDMWQCQACGGAWLDPRPNEATIGLAYEHYYTHDLPTADQPKSLLAKIKASLANGYRNSRFGTRLKPALAPGRVLTELLPHLRWQIDLSYRYLPRGRGKAPRLLDIGCGNGSFLETAKEAGWRTFGVEPDPVARRLAEVAGHDVRPDISEWGDSDGSFDAITMSHVIEHVHDPPALLSTAFSLLGGGGHLFVDTPNIDAVGHQLYGRHWRGLEPPRHLVMFNRDSLRDHLRKAGFTRIRFRPRRDALPFTSAQSRRIAVGLDPYSTLEPSGDQPMPSAAQRVRAILGAHSEFLTVTARKPQ